MFILLDLIGATKPTFYSFWENTYKYFRRLQQIEGLLQDQLSTDSPWSYFVGKSSHSIQDDHIPFLQRGVPILHLISVPFPTVWHTDQDSLENVDTNTIFDLTRVLSTFIAEFLGLAPMTSNVKFQSDLSYNKKQNDII